MYKEQCFDDVTWSRRKEGKGPIPAGETEQERHMLADSVVIV